MANRALLQKKNGKYLWFALLGMGFQPDTSPSSIGGKTNTKYTNLGPNMFDKPNKDAFYIVTHFLLEKLNPARFHEAYRHCWPVVSNKEDVEFRKLTCIWLRELMEETANAGSKVVASLFLSPGGPKFTSLMLHLANHVMLQEMKTFTTDDGWVPEAAAMPASSLDMAVNRLHLIKSRFLKDAVQQDRFLQEYHRRAQVLVKSMRDLRADSAKYDELLKRHSHDSAQEGASPAEKTEMVRSLWSTIDGMLSSTKEEQSVLESVLKGAVDQYTLDGTDRVLKVPRSLLERIEQLPHQLSSGNVYEGGQLNLLCVLELMNHALQLLKEERCHVADAPKPQFSPAHLQEKCQQMARMLQGLHLLRQKISKDEIPEVSSGIKELEEEWDRRWMDTLKDTPLVSFLNEDPALGFLSPMAQLSFEPATEPSYGSSVFSQYPAKLPEKSTECTSPKGFDRSYPHLKSDACAATPKRTDCAAVATKSSSRLNTSLDWLFDTPPSPPLKTPIPPPQADVKAAVPVPPKVAPTTAKTQMLDMEYDNLADQFADAVTTTSPAEDRVKGLDLEGILSTLQGDPFSTRKQLPRTPESLILDVKSSWRKAVEEDEAEKMQRTTKLNDSVTWLSPPAPPYNVSFNPSPPVASHSSPPVTSHSSPPVSQQGATLKSSLLWCTFNTEAPDSPSGTGSSAVQFSLDNETLPEMPSCDSLLSLDDEAIDVSFEEEDEELLIPFLKSESVKTPQTTRCQIKQACGSGSFMGNVRTPECLLLDHDAPHSGSEWLMQPAKSDSTNKVFSLDLDTLDTASPTKTPEYSLPKLITFSPMDDMKS